MTVRTEGEPGPRRAAEGRGSVAALRWFAPTLVVICGLLLVAIVVGQLTNISGSQDKSISLFDFPTVAAVTFTLLGGLVVPRQPHNPIGWLFLAIGLSSGTEVFAASFSGYYLLAWISKWLPAVAYGLLPLVLLVFPTGRLLSRSWRWVAWLAVICLTAAVVGISVTVWDVPTWLVDRHAVLTRQAAVALWIGLAGFVGIIGSMVAAVGVLLVRWRRADGETRQQLKWLGFGAAFIPVGIMLELVDLPGAWILSATTVPAAAAAAILKYKLYDIDLFLNRSLVYAALTLLVVGGYVGIVALLGAVFSAGAEWQRVVATGTIAVVFAPLRERVQRGANRLLYGDRDDPYAVVNRLGRRLEQQVVDPTAVLPRVAETVADALRLPYVAIELTEGADGQQLAASHGRQVSQPEAFAMTYQGQVVGRLLVTPRSSSQPFTATERNLLQDLARQAGLAAHAVALTADLQRSRERLVRSREEERRRLRRDLHDGLGPTLAGMTMQVGAARALLAVNTDQVEGVLGELERQLQNCVQEIRHLVEGLRPSTLDHLGLIGAIHHHIRALSSGQGGSTVEITLAAPDDVGELPAAVEVAAYRIATEAITNTVRHAAASHCNIRLTLNTRLLVEVTDNGVGLPDHYQTGIGLTSMRERTEELGGTFTAQRLPTGGSRIHALLPLVVS